MNVNFYFEPDIGTDVQADLDCPPRRGDAIAFDSRYENLQGNFSVARVTWVIDLVTREYAIEVDLTREQYEVSNAKEAVRKARGGQSPSTPLEGYA